MINDIIIANEIKINIFHGIVFCLISKCSFLSHVGSDKELTPKVYSYIREAILFYKYYMGDQQK